MVLAAYTDYNRQQYAEVGNNTMTWLSFFASIVASIAWPGAVFAVCWLFRKELAAQLPLLRRLTYKGIEFSFERAEEAADKLPPTPKVASTDEDEWFERLAQISPRAAILLTHIDLQQAARSFADSHGVQYPKSRTIRGLLLRLKEEEKIEDFVFVLLDELRAQANNAAKNPDDLYTANDAVRYRQLAKQALSVLEAENMHPQSTRAKLSPG